jgi:hypothetical protein
MSKKHNKRRKQLAKIKTPEKFQPSAEVITAKHWLPELKEAWDREGDMRARVLLEFEAADEDGNFLTEAATVMDPAKPNPVKVIGSNWIHADVHGVLTEETFFEDLAKCIVEFGDMIVKEQNPFQPVRLYKDAESAYGVGFFDWRGDDYGFDLRTLCQFGQWEFTTDKQEQVVASGFKFWLSTLVLPREDDSDVLVGRDMAKGYFDDD